MKLPLSTRLLGCAGFVNRGDRVADIGCDHGYLSIHLLTNGIAKSCIASDVAEGPLQSAMRNARNSAFIKISPFTCPTACAISPGILIPWSAQAWAATP